MDQALSIYFLLGWLGGDLLNLIGSFLADQLPLQVLTEVVGLGQLSSTPNSRAGGWDGCCLIQHWDPVTQTALECSLLPLELLPSLSEVLSHLSHQLELCCRQD